MIVIGYYLVSYLVLHFVGDCLLFIVGCFALVLLFVDLGDCLYFKMFGYLLTRGDSLSGYCLIRFSW